MDKVVGETRCGESQMGCSDDDCRIQNGREKRLAGGAEVK